MGKKLNQEEVKKRIKENFTEEIVTVISEYNGLDEEIKIKCNHCGYILVGSAKKFLRKDIKRRCPRCLKEEKEYFCWKVYEHLFPNGKRYIGITSQLVNDRWNNGRGYYQQKKVKEAINKFGWENIQHNVLYSQLSKDEAEEIETALIEKYNTTNIDFGYNTAFGGLDVHPVKKVAQYDLQGNFINEFNSVREASKIVGCQETSIALVCRQTGKAKKAGGCMWRYITSSEVQLKIPPYSTERGKFINSKNRPRVVIQLDDNKNEIKKWNSIKEASENIDRNISSIIGAIKEGYRCGGYYWKYYNEEE